MMTGKIWAIALLTGFMGACSCDTEACLVNGIGGAAKEAVSNVGSNRPMVPPVNYQEDPYAGYEQHGAVTQNACRDMEARFQREGRRVRLHSIVRNPYNQGGGVLEWLCLFEGEDAHPEATPFEDTRFPPSETNFP